MPNKLIKTKKRFLVTDLEKTADDMCKNLYPYLSKLGFPSETDAVSGLIAKFELTKELATEIYKRWIRDCDKFRADNLAEPHPIHKQRMKTLNILRKSL